MKPSILNPHEYPNFSPKENGDYLVVNNNNETYIETWDTYKWSNNNSDIMYFYTPVLINKGIKSKVNYINNRISYYGC